MARNDQSWVLGSIVDVSDLRVDVAAAVDAIGQLMTRHESLRTLVDSDDGVPIQVVLSEGSLPVSIMECPAADAFEAARMLRDGLIDRGCDHGSDIPVRAALVVVGELVARVVLVYCHITADRAATEVIREDLRDVLVHSTFTSDPALQPLDLAREQKESGAAITQRAVRYWARQLGCLRPTTLTPVDPDARPRLREVTMVSRALHASARRVADRHRTAASTALIAAAAMALRARSGNPRIGINVPVSNRIWPEHRRVVGSLVQYGLFVLDVDADATLDDLVPLAVDSAIRTYRFSYYDQVALDRAREVLNAQRGTPVNPLCCFNSVNRTFDELDPYGGWSDTEIEASRTQTELRLDDDPLQTRCQFCLRVGVPMPGEPHPLFVKTDMRCLDPVQFILDVEEILVSASRGGP